MTNVPRASGLRRLALILPIALLALSGWFALHHTLTHAPAGISNKLSAPTTGVPRNSPAAPQQTSVSNKSATAQAIPAAHPITRPVTPHGQTATTETSANPGQPAAGTPLPADFLDRVVTGTTIAFSLPDGRQVRGNVEQTESNADGLLFVDARLVEPAPGRCSIKRQTFAGMAGPFFGHVRFNGDNVAWKIEPTDDHQAARFVARDIDDVLCVNFAEPPAAGGGDVQQAPQTHPTNIPIPPYQTVIPLQSLPGATGVLYLDFDGESGPFGPWGSFDAVPSGATNAQVFEIWKMVVEDYQGFNLNITTDRKVFDQAAVGRRQQIIITPTNTAAPGAGGVAYIGSYNSNYAVCWSFITTGKSAAEVISHELGHTLGLSHDGNATDEYYGGQGSGDTGWAPIMGASYSKNLTQWSKGEYSGATNTQDDLSIIANNNNNVGYRTDDCGDNLATARYLDIFSNNTVTGEGIIERTGDVDAFRFRSTGGQASITANPVTTNPNLDIHAEIVEAASLTAIASNNPDLGLSATVSANLPAGEYLFRVRGTGRGDPLVDGYSNYGSLGTYLISGTVANGVIADRFSIVENSANGTAVGTVAARNNHGTNTLTWAIASGNTNGALAINPATGAITVANSTALNYEALSTRWDDPADLELFVTITDATNPALNESIRTVVTVTNVNEAPLMTAGTFDVYEYAAVGSWVGTVAASEPDRFDYLTFSILDGDPGGLFSIEPYTGAIRVATAMNMAQDKTFNLTVRAVDQGSPALATTVTCAVHVINVSGNAATVYVSGDNGYELYVNGSLAGSGGNWYQAGQHSISLMEGANVIAIKGTDAGGVAALLAEIVYAGQRIGTGTAWKVSLSGPANWQTTGYNDSGWAAATDYGAYGVSPWNKNVAGMPGDTPAHWIWSSNNDADNTVYFRYSITGAPVTYTNDPPVIAQGGSIGVLMNKDSSPMPFGLTLNASDANGDTITWSLAAAASHGTAAVSGTGASKTISYTPAAGYTGSDSFVVQAADGNGGTDTITVNVTIWKVTSALWWTPAAVTAESNFNTRPPVAAIDGSGMSPNNPVTATSTCQSSPDATMWLSNNSLNTWITFDLGSVKTLTGFHLWNYNESGTYTGRGVRTAGIYVGTSQPDSGSSYASMGAAWGSLAQSFTFAQATGSGTYKGEDYYFGSPVTGRYIQLYVTSNFGTSDYYTGLSEIRFFGLNSLILIANAQNVTAKQNTAKAITLTGSDPGDNPLTYAIVTQPSHGSLTGTPPNVTYTPNSGYTGTDAFTFKVNNGSVDSSPAAVSITVQSNDAPIANAQSITTNAKTATAVILTGSDVNGDTLTYAIVTLPSHGTLSGTPPNVTYTPTTGYSGADAFTFKVNDGVVDSTPATVSITVLANDPPVANAQSVTAQTATGKAITLTASDANGDTLTYSIATQPSHGTLSGTAPNVTYTSASGYSGSDSFTFRANDGTVNSTPATVSLTIYQTTGPTAAFWAGGSNANWTTAANWKTTVADGIATTGAPANQTNVTFTTTTPVAANLTNTLDADCHVNSVTFATTATSPVTVNGTKILKIGATTANGNTSGNGITVGTPATGTVTHTIGANVALTASQTCTVNSAGISNNSTLTATGNLTDFGAGYTLTKAGAGTLNLLGTTSLGGLTVGYGGANAANYGTVAVGSGGTMAIGTGPSGSVYVGVGTGSSQSAGPTGTLDVAAATSFVANVGTFKVGGTVGGTGYAYLGTSNTITAATEFGVNHGNWGFPNGYGTVTTAANGTTTIHSPAIFVGHTVPNGTTGGWGRLTLGNGATLNIDGLNKGRAAMWIGIHGGWNDGNPNGPSYLDLSGGGTGKADLKLKSVLVGQLRGGSVTESGELTLSTSPLNHLDISGSSIVCVEDNAVTIPAVVAIGWNAATGTANGTFTIGNLDATSSIRSETNGTVILLAYKSSSGASNGTLNLNGGTLTLTTTGTAITGGTGTSTLNLDGGVTLKAGASSTTWIQGLTTAKIKSGGVVFDTNGNAITVAQPLLADATSPGGGLTKSGTGILTLGGSNTYTGATIVNNGTLALGATGSLSTAGVNLASGARFDTTAQANYAIPAAKPFTLHLTGSGPGAAGKITATGLDITNATVVLAIDSALNDAVYVLAEYGSLSGSAFASVTTPPAGYSLNYTYQGNKIALVANAGYAVWAGAFSNPPLTITTATADPDGDGLPNVLEYVLGTDPRSANPGGPTGSGDPTNLIVTFNRSDASEADVTLVVQISTNLIDWTTLPGYSIGATTATSTSGVEVTENGTAADTITVKIPKNGKAQTYARLRAVLNN